MGDFLGDDFLINRTDSASMLVAVKIMRTDADSKARYLLTHVQFMDVSLFFDTNAENLIYAMFVNARLKV